MVPQELLHQSRSHPSECLSLNEHSIPIPSQKTRQIPQQHTGYRSIKRVFDILFSIVMLLLCLPLFLVVACLIKMNSKGPIFYCSTRLGQQGQLFKCWKFRSMYQDADARLEQLLSNNASLRSEWDKYCKLRDDPRLTYIGKRLRKTSFDELPQFWNVFKGDLSVVGPRPYLPKERERIYAIIGDQIDTLLSIRPGLTGLWQTSGRNFLTFEKRVRLDLAYVYKHSLISDLKFILKTIPMMIFPKGAF